MSGLGAIIDGAFKGYAFGEQVKDKKRRRAIEDEKLTWDREDRDYLKTQRKNAADDRAFEVSERERAIRLRAEDEAVAADAYSAAEQEHQTRAATNPAELPGVTAAPTAPAAPSPSSSATGLSMIPPVSAPRSAPQPLQPPSAAHDAPPLTMVNPSPPAPGAPGSGVPLSFINDPEVQARLQQSSLPAERVWPLLKPEVQKKWLEADAATARAPQPAPPVQPAPVRSMMPVPAPAPTQTAEQPPAAFLRDPGVQARLQQSTLTPEQAWSYIPENEKAQYRAANGPSAGGFTNVDALPTPPAVSAPPSVNRSAPVLSSRGDEGPALLQVPGYPGYPGTDKAPQAPATQTAPNPRRSAPTQPVSRAEVEQTAAAGNEDPNVEAAKAAAVMTMQPPAPGRRVNQQAKSRAADSFLDTYQRVAVPQIMEHYLKRGEFDKAKSFETWIKTAEAEKLQKEFGNLTFSLAVGDFDGALDHMAGMYENVNDGYTINREKSRFETYDNGQPRRLVVVIEDGEGNVFEQIIEDQGDLASQVLGIVNPQAAHEYLLARNEAAVNARAKTNSIIKPIDRAEVSAEVKRIKDDLVEQQGNAILSSQPFEMPSDAEIERMAIENLRARDAALSSGRSYTTPGTPVPDWRPAQ